uniref:hypothetical protein n=1 Tax=Algoriphagus sp. TaxID=1872435 RepID=UPI002582B25C|nr:hypothetical protein [Algoriphagus sp.]
MAHNLRLGSILVYDGHQWPTAYSYGLSTVWINNDFVKTMVENLRNGTIRIENSFNNSTTNSNGMGSIRIDKNVLSKKSKTDGK